MDSTEQIQSNIARVKCQISQAASRSGRTAGAVRLLAVTKMVGIEAMRAANSAGQFLFGENYVQEARKKLSELGPSAGYEFHFIGSLQRNKAPDAVGLFSLIHTVDRIELATVLSEHAGRKNLQQKILLQINISQEASKSGVDPAQAALLAKRILGLPNLSLEGVMCIGSYFEPSQADEIRRREFKALHAIRGELERSIGHELRELSMGMSHDFELAVEEGATIVRVGTAIFGERPPKTASV